MKKVHGTTWVKKDLKPQGLKSLRAGVSHLDGTCLEGPLHGEWQIATSASYNMLLLLGHLVAREELKSTWSDSAAYCSSSHTSMSMGNNWEIEVRRSSRLSVSNKLLKHESPKMHLVHSVCTWGFTAGPQ